MDPDHANRSSSTLSIPFYDSLTSDVPSIIVEDLIGTFVSIDAQRIRKMSANAFYVLVAADEAPFRVPPRCVYIRVSAVPEVRHKMSVGGGVSELPQWVGAMRSTETAFHSIFQVCTYLITAGGKHLKRPCLGELILRAVAASDPASVFALTAYGATLSCRGEPSSLLVAASLKESVAAIQVLPGDGGCHRDLPVDVVVLLDGTQELAALSVTTMEKLRPNDRVAVIWNGSKVVPPSFQEALRSHPLPSIVTELPPNVALRVIRQLQRSSPQGERALVLLVLSNASSVEASRSGDSVLSGAPFVKKHGEDFLGVRIDAVGIGATHHARSLFSVAMEGRGTYRSLRDADVGAFSAVCGAQIAEWRSTVACAVAVSTAIPSTVSSDSVIFTEASNTYFTLDVQKQRARVAVLGPLCETRSLRFCANTSLAGVAPLMVVAFRKPLWSSPSPNASKPFDLFVVSFDEPKPGKVLDLGGWWRCLKLFRAGVLYAAKGSDMRSTWSKLEKELRALDPAMHSRAKCKIDESADQRMEEALLEVLNAMYSPRLSAAVTSNVATSDSVGSTIDMVSAIHSSPPVVNGGKKGDDVSHLSQTADEAVVAAPPAAQETSQQGPQHHEDPTEDSAALVSSSEEGSRPSAAEVSVVALGPDHTNGKLDETTASPYVDPRWVCLNDGVPTVSSLEAALRREPSAGIVTNKSFSVALGALRNSSAYLTFPPLQIPREQRKGQRKLFLLAPLKTRLPDARKALMVMEAAAIGWDATEHVFENMERGVCYTVVHLATTKVAPEWFGLADMTISDGIEFHTPALYCTDLRICEVHSQSVSIEWECNCPSTVVSVNPLSEGGNADASKGAMVFSTSQHATLLQDLAACALYRVTVSPSTLNSEQLVEDSTCYFCTAPLFGAEDIQCDALESTVEDFPIVVKCVPKSYKLEHEECTAFVHPVVTFNSSTASEMLTYDGRSLEVSVGYKMELSFLCPHENRPASSIFNGAVVQKLMGPWYHISRVRTLAVSHDSATISWCSSASEFRILASSGLNETEFCVVISGKTQATLTGLAPDSCYTATVTAANSVNAPTITFHTPPSQPARETVDVEYDSMNRTVRVRVPSEEHRPESKKRITYDITLQPGGQSVMSAPEERWETFPLSDTPTVCWIETVKRVAVSDDDGRPLVSSASEPTALSFVRNLCGSLSEDGCFLLLSWALKSIGSGVVTVALGNDVTETTLSTSTVAIPTSGPALRPLTITGSKVCNDAVTHYVMSTPIALAATLFDTVLFEDSVDVTCRIGNLARDLDGCDTTGMVRYSLDVKPAFLPALTVPLGTSEAPKFRVPLMINRGPDAALHIRLVAEFDEEQGRQQNSVCLNGKMYSAVTELPTPIVYDIRELLATDITPHSFKLSWRSLCKSFNVSVTTTANGTLFVTETKECRYTLDECTADTVYIVKVTSAHAGGHSASLLVATPPDAAISEEVAKSVVVEENTVRCFLPGLQRHAVKGAGADHDEVRVLSVVRVWGSPPEEWVNQSENVKPCTYTVPPTAKQQWPHMTWFHRVVHGDQVLVEGPQQRMDILGRPTLVKVSDTLVSLSWCGSATQYTVAFYDDEHMTTLRHQCRCDEPKASYSCKEDSGHVLWVLIRAAETHSNSLRFAVLIPRAPPRLNVASHVPGCATVMLDPPETHADVSCRFTVKFGDVMFSHSGEDPTKPQKQIIRGLAPDAPATLLYCCKISVAGETAQRCLDPTAELTATLTLPRLCSMNNIRLAAVGATTLDLAWESQATEFAVDIVSYPAVAAASAAEATPRTEGSSPPAENVGMTLTRTVVCFQPTINVRSLLPCTLHEVTVRSSQCGDHSLVIRVFTLPAFPEKSVVLRRHDNMPRCTVLFNLPRGTFRCADVVWESVCFLELLDPSNRLIESRRVEESTSVELVSDATCFCCRRAVLFVEKGSTVANPKPEECVKLCQVPRVPCLRDVRLVRATAASLYIEWGCTDTRPTSYSVSCRMIASLNGGKQKVPVHMASSKCLVVAETKATLSSLTPASLYEVVITVDGVFPIQPLIESKVLVLHDDASQADRMIRLALTSPLKRAPAPRHKRYFGGLTAFMDPTREAHGMGLVVYTALRVAPGNTVFVSSRPTHYQGTPFDGPTEPIFTETSGSQNNSEYHEVDWTVREPPNEREERLEYYTVIEAMDDLQDKERLLNDWAWSEADAQPIQRVRAVSQPHVVHVTSKNAELEWIASEPKLRFDVCLVRLTDTGGVQSAGDDDEPLLGLPPESVTRVADSRVSLPSLRSCSLYGVTVCPSHNEVPCEPLRFVFLTAPKRMKPPPLRSVILNVLFELPASTVQRMSIAPYGIDEPGNLTLTHSCVLVCTKETSTKDCVTASDFVSLAEPRNVFKSDKSRQRFDVRLRSGKTYQFVFFSSVHHPQAINGVVHSKPTVVDFTTDTFPPENLHFVTRTRTSITLGWSCLDVGAREMAFDIQRLELAGLAGNAHIPSAEFEAAVGSDRLEQQRVVSRAATGPQLYCTFANLRDECRYAMRVRTSNPNCPPSAWSEAIVGMTLRPPRPVEKLTVVGLTPTSIRLSWRDPQVTPGSEAMTYVVSYRPTDVPKAKGPTAVSKDRLSGELKAFECCAELCGLVSGAQYRITVVPQNHVGESCTSGNAVVTVRTEVPQNWKV